MTVVRLVASKARDTLDSVLYMAVPYFEIAELHGSFTSPLDSFDDFSRLSLQFLRLSLVMRV